MINGSVDYFCLSVRFICGALFGLLIGLGFYVSIGVLISESASWAIGSFGLPAVLFGVLAAAKGDAFWDNVRESYWWRVFFPN